MAQTQVSVPVKVVERNILLVREIMDYLLHNPQVFSSLPDKFELVILPENDPEMRLYNLELLDKYGSEDKPIVFARVKVGEESVAIQDKPSLYAPIPVYEYR
jgi:hypothetical protein